LKAPLHVFMSKGQVRESVINYAARIGASKPDGITLKSPKEIELMRAAGKVVAQTKAKVLQAVRPGVTSRELDQIAEKEIRRMGAVPSFKGYRGFPATICVSFNEEIVHGIPSGRVLKEGDVVSLDFGAVVGGFHSDSAVTVGVGKVSPEAQRLMDVTRDSLLAGIAQVQPGNRIGDIAAAVQEYAETRGYGVVREYVGHGIGRALHEDPQVPNYGIAGRGPLLKVGMVLAIEPMLNIGGWQTKVLKDGWTVVTADGTISAHFEDTVAITENGVEVLTALQGVVGRE